ncbi:hypothetical protein BDR07DRAFT_1379431 [Suillus spraguei]|nr:hypothetical protein BDR07DRAFT_1379431 [Suillus spraguei]
MTQNRQIKYHWLTQLYVKVALRTATTIYNLGTSVPTIGIFAVLAAISSTQHYWSRRCIEEPSYSSVPHNSSAMTQSLGDKMSSTIIAQSADASLYGLHNADPDILDPIDPKDWFLLGDPSASAAPYTNSSKPTTSGTSTPLRLHIPWLRKTEYLSREGIQHTSSSQESCVILFIWFYLDGLAKAEVIGYPVMIKASEGGGGNGILKVDHPDAFKNALHAIAGEISACHLEVQLLTYQYGNAISLFRRANYSIQHHYQKIIEKAPITIAKEDTFEQTTLAPNPGSGDAKTS